MNLYEIKEQYLSLLEKIENGEIPEDAIKDTLESVEGDFQDKADNVASYIKSLLAEATALKDEMDKLTARKKQKEAKAESLRLYLENMMKQADMKKIETTRNVLTVKLSPPSVKVDDGFMAWWSEQNGLENLVRTKLTSEPNKEELKKRLADGYEVPHCKLEQSEKLNIK